MRCLLKQTKTRIGLRCCNTTNPHECLVILKVHLGAHVLLNSRAAVVTKVPDRHGHLEAAGSMGCNGKNGDNRISFRQTLVEIWGHLGMGVEKHLKSTKVSYKKVKSAFSAS